jgi:hypothetical protein
MTIVGPSRLFILCSPTQNHKCDVCQKCSTPVTCVRSDLIVYCRIIDLANSSVKFIIYPAAIDVMLSSSLKGYLFKSN